MSSSISKTEDQVLIKSHTAGPFSPVYVGDYKIVSIKGNQIKVNPSSGGKTQMNHISDVKYVLPADNKICKLPNYS